MEAKEKGYEGTIDDFRNRDYAGLTALTGRQTVGAEEEKKPLVEDFLQETFFNCTVVPVLHHSGRDYCCFTC